MSAAHSHDHVHVSLGAGARHRGRLALVLALTAVFLVVEVVTAFATNSLALLSDAGHMLTDVLGLAMALTAIELAGRHTVRRPEGGRTGGHTYGLYRLEIIASFCNTLLLFGVAGYVVVESIRRIGSTPAVTGTPMLVVAAAGLAVNVVAYVVLREGARESLNVEGAALEVLADLVGSVGVLVAALLVMAFGWTWADAACGIAIGMWILPRAWRLGGRSLRILLQAAPADIDLGAVRADLGSLAGVVDVHDLHVWTLTSGMDAASVHLVITESTDHHAVLDQARDLLVTRYEIGHATLQVEPSDHRGCDEIGW
jgi:cobalt-zinc-cadmium efflux system protein